MVKKKDSRDKLRINPLQVEKETVQDLDAGEMQQVAGGVGPTDFQCNLSQGGNCGSLLGTCGGKTCGKKCATQFFCGG